LAYKKTEGETMKSKAELVAAIRELADRVEASETLDCDDFRIEISSYHNYEIERLRSFTGLIDGEIKADSNRGTHWVKGFICGFAATAYYKAGLLGRVKVKKVVERATESTPNLSLLK
jgi:hypothetical protein